MFPVVAVKTQIFPITTVSGIVVVIVVFVMNGEFVQILASKLAAATRTYPGVQPQRLLAIASHAFVGVATRSSDDVIELVGIDFRARLTASPGFKRCHVGVRAVAEKLYQHH